MPRTVILAKAFVFLVLISSGVSSFASSLPEISITIRLTSVPDEPNLNVGDMGTITYTLDGDLGSPIGSANGPMVSNVVASPGIAPFFQVIVDDAQFSDTDILLTGSSASDDRLTIRGIVNLDDAGDLYAIDLLGSFATAVGSGLRLSDLDVDQLTSNTPYIDGFSVVPSPISGFGFVDGDVVSISVANWPAVPEPCGCALVLVGLPTLAGIRSRV